jgi:uncharacterized membrane protein
MHDFNYFGFLVLLSTLVGAVWIALLIRWLLNRQRLSGFRRILLACISAGAIVPIAISLTWMWIRRYGSPSTESTFEIVAITLWPTSIELMALEGPSPDLWNSIASITLVYGVSILGNIGIYGVVGIIFGGIWRWIQFQRSDNSGAKE